MRSLSEEQRGGVRCSWGSVSGAGAVSAPGSADWTIVRTGVGTYSLYFNKPFRRMPELILTPSGVAIVGSVGVDNRQMNIVTYTAAGAAADQPFHFVATGH